MSSLSLCVSFSFILILILHDPLLSVSLPPHPASGALAFSRCSMHATRSSDEGEKGGSLLLKCILMYFASYKLSVSIINVLILHHSCSCLERQHIVFRYSQTIVYGEDYS